MNLKAIRIAKGMQSEELAQAVGVKPRQIRSWEYGEREPSIRLLIALADALGCTVDALIRPKKEGDGIVGPDQDGPIRSDL